ncbi:hypothetical protein P7K49_012786 [Saguinus oedipus]|uniref:Uncharacterized protein n=1 Tax=Saguinus oedipus TaxID=9490 RepID=A0ABQ9VE22_SAGOE|nr:hypothetical protein P7K49_012786 [Saguinus oedipus]
MPVLGAAAVSPPVRCVNGFRSPPGVDGLLPMSPAPAWEEAHTGRHRHCRRALGNHGRTQQRDALSTARLRGLQEEKGTAEQCPAPSTCRSARIRACPGLASGGERGSEAPAARLPPGAHPGHRDSCLRAWELPGRPRRPQRRSGGFGESAGGPSRTAPLAAVPAVDRVSSDDRKANSWGCGDLAAFPPCLENPTKGVALLHRSTGLL